MRGTRGRILALLLALLAGSGRAGADSLFSAGGFGLPVVPADGRGMGMGGVAAALDGEGFSPLNPATLADFNRSAISGMIIPTYAWSRDHSASSVNRSYEFSFARLVFPLPGGFVFSAGLNQTLDFDRESERDLTFEGETVTETFRSTGTLFQGGVAVARPLFFGLRAGLGVDFYRGAISDLHLIGFQGAVYPFGTAIDVRDEYEYDTDGRGITAGFLFAPDRRIRAGFHYTPAFDLDLDETFRTSGGTVSRRSRTAGMPGSWGVGIAARPLRRLLLAFDYRLSDWSSFTFDGGEEDVDLRDERTVAFGAELSGRSRRETRWWRRSALRGGFRWRALPMQAGGARVDERVGTIGWGIPLGKGTGRFDLAVEIGSRGDLAENGARERFLRFGVALSAFEKWVPVERRRRR
jgi:hypothetical protein